MRKVSYVYLHVIEGKIVWVGKGKNGRIYDSKRIDPNHEELILRLQEAGDFSYARMHTAGLSDKEAVELEKVLIKDLKPIFNRHTYDKKKVRVYPDLTPKEAIALGSINAVKSPKTGKRGKGKKLL